MTDLNMLLSCFRENMSATTIDISVRVASLPPDDGASRPSPLMLPLTFLALGLAAVVTPGRNTGHFG